MAESRRKEKSIPYQQYRANRQKRSAAWLNSLYTSRHPPRRWRIRLGDYRVIYLLNDASTLVTIVRVAHRKEVYEP